MDIQSAIKLVIEGNDLPKEDMHTVMHAIMTGECTPAQIAGFLIGLRMKGETINEITAAAQVMRKLSTKVATNCSHLIDTCGTGGDGTNTFNISTTSAFVVAAAGASVAKHGNRSVSSNSGSADVLEAAGVKLDITPEQVAQCISDVGIGFMFAPSHHSAMKHAVGPRRELGVRTLFNVLGPLTNPAGAPNQVLGVFSNIWLKPLAQVLQQLGSQHVMVVHSDDGMDEISISAPTQIVELVNNEIKTYSITPEQFGLTRADITTLAVDSIEASLNALRAVLDNTEGSAKDIVILNAGAAIYTAGLADNLEASMEQANNVIKNGAAKEKLDALIELTQQF
jgi:anthranilate phosphoribosyltransferase